LEISPTNEVNAVFLSSDGRLAAIIPAPRLQPKAPIQIWDVAQRRRTTVPPLTAPFGGEPVFSPDGSKISMGIPGGTAVVGQPPTNPPPTNPPPGARPKLPQAKMVVVDVRTGKSRQLGTTACGSGWRSQPFSGDGRLLAAGSFCGDVQVWDLASGHRVGRSLSIGGELAKIAFSPDATRVAIASWNSSITIADVRTGRIVAVLTDHTRGIPDIAYSPDGRYFASASLDHTARVWDAHTLRVLRILDHPDPVYGVEFSRNSREVVTTDGAQVVRVWDACTACGDRTALLALARSRVTRALTAQEQRTFLAR
jgi:WD40 repeat protein